jgi:hypothetical protein
MASWRRKIIHAYLNVCREGITAGNSGAIEIWNGLITLTPAIEYTVKPSERNGSDLAHGISEELVRTGPLGAIQ